jgi:hypothetical protein
MLRTTAGSLQAVVQLPFLYAQAKTPMHRILVTIALVPDTSALAQIASGMP